MNNDKVRALFMAQYLGQQVLIFANHIPHIYELCGGHLDNFNTPESHLLLRTVDQLTDEEVIQIALLMGLSSGDFTIEHDEKGITLNAGEEGQQMLITFDDISIYFTDLDTEYSVPGINHKIAYDYLRSIAILLPITYLSDNHPVTLSTDEILNLGWAKIKSN